MHEKALDAAIAAYKASYYAPPDVSEAVHHAIETYLLSAQLSNHHVGLVLSNVMYKAQSRATQQRCIQAISDLHAAGCQFIQSTKGTGGSDA